LPEDNKNSNTNICKAHNIIIHNHW